MCVTRRIRVGCAVGTSKKGEKIRAPSTARTLMEIVITLPGHRVEVEVVGHVSPSVKHDSLSIRGLLRSSTAQPIVARSALVRIKDKNDDSDDRDR